MKEVRIHLGRSVSLPLKSTGDKYRHMRPDDPGKIQSLPGTIAMWQVVPTSNQPGNKPEPESVNACLIKKASDESEAFLINIFLPQLLRY
jgi:hypothetical protein